MATAKTENEIYDNFKCSICLEIYEEPVTVPCGNNHTFCAECVEPQRRSEAPSCTLCRQLFNPSRIIKNKHVRTQMRTLQIECLDCHENIILNQMRDHQAKCSMIDRTIKKFQPIRGSSQQIAKDLPNRQTFPCPYCHKANFDNKSLVEHCNKYHTNEPIAVVCPICSSMPWGDKAQISGNFIQHLNMRHIFEYDTYVDYQQDDDEMLRAAIQASLENS